MPATDPDPVDDPVPETSPMSLPAFRLGPRTRVGRVLRRRRADQARTDQARGLTEWHLMTDGQREAAWTQLRAWVTWLHDRYELGTEERLPRCWPDHPGLVEELHALKAWREEIYQPGQPAGQAARYWHAELRQVIQAATTWYAAGCRTGHRRPTARAAEDPELQRQWSAASPLTGIPPADLAAGCSKDQPGEWLDEPAVATAIDTGQAQALNHGLPGYIQHAGTWWMPGAGGWVPVTDTPFAALLDAWARRPDTTEPVALGPGTRYGQEG
ncbi:MAG TPA: hypothetical protein VGH27_02155 [Streptosporangiaceae bacterium]|jgi:hypothetical protein